MITEKQSKQIKLGKKTQYNNSHRNLLRLFEYKWAID